MSDICVGLCTCPDRDIARKIAEHLVAQNLAACVNILGDVESVYRWQGAVQHDNEVQLLVKTDKGSADAVYRCIEQLHPYEVPEWVLLDVTGGSQPYLDWVRSSLT